MVTGLALSILVLSIPGTLLVRSLWSPKPPLRPHLLLTAVLGTGLGFGISSVLFFLWLNLLGSHPGAYPFVETTLALCAVAALVRLGKRVGVPTTPAPGAVPGADRRLTRLTAGALFISFACILASAVVTLLREPHGQGDATAIWNLLARFIYRDAGGWADTLSHRLAWTHADYPLLLPLSVARLWQYAGETQAAPAFIALFFTFGTLALIVSSVSVLRTRTQGYLAGLVLLEPFLFFRVGTYLYADTPVGFFLLAALVLFCLHDRGAGGEGRRLLMMAGMMAGFAAWTKNEGLLFVAAVVAARLAAVGVTQGVRPCLRQMLPFAAGAVPVLLVVVYFKAAIAPANDLVAGQGFQATAGRLLDFSRYVLILKYCVIQFTGFRKWYAHPTYLLAVYAWLLGVKVGRAGRTSLLTLSATLGLIAAGYFFIYVTTPRDLEWHLTFSLDRLLIQLWPGLVLLYFFSVRSPEEALAGPTNPSEAEGGGRA
jgi:hypothetical protein